MTTQKPEDLSFLEGQAAQESNKGFEDINSNTVSIPYIKLLQQLSPELNEKKPEYIKEAKIGMFVNSVTNDLLGLSFKFIVIGFERLFVEWKPNRGGLVGYHTPEEAERITLSTEFGKWKTKAGNLLVETYMYKGLIPGKEEKGIVVCSLTSSNITEAKVWNRELKTTLLPNGSTAPGQFIVWTVSSSYAEKGENSWYKWSIKFCEFINQKQYALVSKERSTLATKSIEYVGEQKALPANDKSTSEDSQEVNY